MREGVAWGRLVLGIAQAILVATTGQSIGKKLLRMKIVLKNGSGREQTQERLGASDGFALGEGTERAGVTRLHGALEAASPSFAAAALAHARIT